MYDIDKVYAIMAALDRNGIYKDLNEGEVTIVDSVSNLGINLSEEEIDINTQLGNIILTNNLEQLPIVIDQINQYLKNGNIRISKEFLLDINNLIRLNVNASEDTIRVWRKLTRKKLNKRANNVLSTIKDELIAKSGLEKTSKDQIQAMQNYILEAIKSIYRDPRTLMASTDPTTMDPVNDIVKELNLEAAKRNHFNPLTDIFVNQTTSVGKKDIGISAVAQKAFYALTYYYNIKQEQGQNVANYIQIDLPESWRLTTKSLISFGFPTQKLNIASYNYLLNVFKTWNVISSKVIAERTETLYNNTNVYVKIVSEKIGDKTIETFFIGENPKDLKLVEIGSKLGTLVPTTDNSSIISSSTDNAKEMKMDLLNATPEILPAYEFCLSLGIDLKQAAIIFTDPIINALITVSRGDLFNKERSVGRISSVLKNKNHLARVKSLYDTYVNRQVSESEFNSKVAVLRQLFEGAEELTSLGQLLGINGGIKVEFGAPLLFQLKVEDIIQKATGKTFSFEKFLNEPLYAQEWIQLYDQYKISFNILDIINTVPHYKEMFTVPIQFKRNMQLLSKDIDNVYTIAYRELANKYQVDEKVLRNLLRIINDRKIQDFFITQPFTYTSNQIIKRINNKNGIEKIMLDQPTQLSTNTFEGLITLKTYIESVIIPEIKTRYPKNMFATNLIANTIFSPLFQERYSFIGSRINLSDPQYEDMTGIIKDNFYKIQHDDINGHSIYEWMFVYDLLVNKHATGGNSITMLLDNNLNLDDPNNIVSKWVKYINSYDKMISTYSNLEEVKKIPNLKDKFGRETNNDYMMYDVEIDPLLSSMKSKRPSWAINPTYFPFFTSIKNFGMQVLVYRNVLFEAFTKGIITAKLC